jgi:hypothetical protein
MRYFEGYLEFFKVFKISFYVCIPLFLAKSLILFCGTLVRKYWYMVFLKLCASNTVGTFLWNVIPRKVRRASLDFEVWMHYSKTGNIGINLLLRRGLVIIVALDKQ